jgi:tetratricopeptide (TPR) repeat protein
MPPRLRSRTLPIAAGLALVVSPAAAQDFILDESGEFRVESAPTPGSDEWVMAEAARALAADDPDAARALLNPWIEANKRLENEWLPRAYLLRGDALVMDRDEYKALYDYEAVIKQFPGSEEFQTAVQREMEIAQKYLDGMRRKLWGMFRVESARRLGEELMIRAQERVPGSRLSEDAAIRLAEHYFKTRRLDLASEMYDIFLKTYPNSDYAKTAMLGQIYANVAGFKGPRYDASGLVEAELLLDGFVERYPADALRDGVVEGLATRIDESRGEQMLESARWYLRRGDPVSAEFVLKRLLRRHPATNAAQTALRIMRDEGMLDEGPPPATLGEGVPDPVDAIDAIDAPFAEPPPPAEAPDLVPQPSDGGRP